MDKYLDDEPERKTWLMATQDLSHELDDKDEIDKTQELSSQVKMKYKLRQSHHSNLKHKQKQKQKLELKSNVQEYNITTRIFCTGNSRIYKIYKTHQEWISKSPNQMANHRIHESEKQAWFTCKE